MLWGGPPWRMITIRAIIGELESFSDGSYFVRIFENRTFSVLVTATLGHSTATALQTTSHGVGVQGLGTSVR